MKATAVIADAQYLTRMGAIRICTDSPAIEEIVTVTTREELEKTLSEHPESILILDYLRFNAMEAADIRALREKFPDAGLVIISADEDRNRIFAIAEAGVHSFLSKNCSEEEIHNAVLAVSRRKKFFCNSILEIILEGKMEAENVNNCQPSELTDREFEVLLKVLDGKSAKDIGEELFLSIHTVYTHRKNILRKLGVKNSSELLKYALKSGIISPNGEVNT